MTTVLAPSSAGLASAGPVAVPAAVPAAAAADAARSAAAGGLAERPSEQAALALARKTGRGVAVSAVRSRTAPVFANPSGTLTLEQHAVPVRTRDNAGYWVPVDTTLHTRPDGSIAPTATALTWPSPAAGRARTLAAIAILPARAQELCLAV